MSISVLDLFKIGIGPSSSHTVGPMRAAHDFAAALAQQGLRDAVRRIEVRLYGSLSATGVGENAVHASRRPRFSPGGALGSTSSGQRVVTKISVLSIGGRRLGVARP